MQKKYFVLISLLFFLLSISLKAQEPWTLEQCIKYAFDNNIQIKQQMLGVKMNEGKLFQSKMGALPNLNASVNHSYAFGRPTLLSNNSYVSGNSQSDNFSIYASVSLFKGLQTLNSIDRDKFNLLATASDVEKVKNNIALSIASAYLQILYSEDLVTSSQKQLDLSKMQVDRTAVLVKAGSSPEGSLLEIEAQAASDELQLVNSQNQLDLAYLTLTQYLDIKTPEGFKIQKPNLDNFDNMLIDLSPTGIFELAQKSMPQVLSAGYKVASAEKSLKISKGALYPTLNLNGSYSSGYQKILHNTNPLLEPDPFYTQIKDNATK